MKSNRIFSRANLLYCVVAGCFSTLSAAPTSQSMKPLKGSDVVKATTMQNRSNGANFQAKELKPIAERSLDLLTTNNPSKASQDTEYADIPVHQSEVELFGGLMGNSTDGIPKWSKISEKGSLNLGMRIRANYAVNDTKSLVQLVEMDVRLNAIQAVNECALNTQTLKNLIPGNLVASFAYITRFCHSPSLCFDAGGMLQLEGLRPTPKFQLQIMHPKGTTFSQRFSLGMLASPFVFDNQGTQDFFVTYRTPGEKFLAELRLERDMKQGAEAEKGVVTDSLCKLNLDFACAKQFAVGMTVSVRFPPGSENENKRLLTTPVFNGFGIRMKHRNMVKSGNMHRFLNLRKS